MKIVLDADGVLLDYNAQMAKIYQKTLNRQLKFIKHSHHFKNMYGVEFLPEEKKAIYKLFDTEGWNSMPAIDGAVEATQALHKAGHTLICLSSMPEQFVEARSENFKSLGIPFERVIGSGRDESDMNPKSYHITSLQPDIFVDDQLRNFKDVPDSICKVWIDNGFHDSPDIGLDSSIADFKFNSIKDFSIAVIQNCYTFIKNKRLPKI